MHHEGKRGTKDLGSKWLLYVRKKRATIIGIGGRNSRQPSPLGRGGPTYKTLKKTLELEFVKQANRISSRFRKMRKCTLWRGWPPLKQKKEFMHRVGARNVGAPAIRNSFAPPKKKRMVKT
jgi:hypothetical protein